VLVHAGDPHAGLRSLQLPAFEGNHGQPESSDAAAGAVATHPRVTLDDIEGAIAARFEFTADAVAAHVTSAHYAAHFEVPKAIEPLKLLSICLLVMRNGFTVIGTSAPASPENFNAEFGRKLAYENAIRQLWPLMGFALRDKLAAAQA
jgi:hypothetical protein